jgi:pimeloyl-ACP methyl ester carboxylesterase
MIEYLRTPEDRFENLPDFPYQPHYINDLKGYDGMRLHYVDEGSQDSNEVFLCFHGQPTWSYLYRKMIPIFLEAGYRVIAPDYFGFGRSDKPVEEGVYTFEFHRNSLIGFINHLDLKNITLVCQDWGGLLGLTLPVDMPERFKRLLIMNTWLGVGDVPLSKGFLFWRDWNNKTPDLEPGRLIARQCPQLSEKEKAAYNAPFPDIKYKAGIRRFPNLVPDSPDAPGAKTSQRAREWFQNDWSGESFMAVGMQDPVLGPSVMRILRSYIKDCPKPLRIKEAGHFVQEWGETIAKKAIESFKI